AEKLGIAFQLTNILRDIKEDKDMGRIYIPQQEIKKFGVTVQDIQNENFSLPIKNLIKHQIQRAREYYQQAFPGIAMLSKHSQYSIYSALNIYQGILGKIEKNDYNPFLGRVYVPFLNKLCIILSQFFRTRVLF
ncbi:squalene/phytoene synthase family protein, partial [candidate division KSB1 bacterium]|nr:squalene/phytoene synthase family protein [candidate division KSB1 bacterium]